MVLNPQNLDELQQVVREHTQLLPRGGGTKPALSVAPAGAHTLDMRGISGIIEYDPGEYTFTAYAGTPLAEITAALAEHGQYMPFDPLLVDAGATLGGTVAANTSGSGRYRYGGVRDFILGVQFVDGQGQLVRSGGKVVKNAAGFDLPKFFVGSMGRYGVLTELTFKVFPQPQRYITLRLRYGSLADALEAIYCLNTSPLEADCVDLEQDGVLVIRLGGTDAALSGRRERLTVFLQEHTELQSAEVGDEAYWQTVNAFGWAADRQAIVKVPVSPRQIPALDGATPAGATRRYSVGGNVAWIATDDPEALGHILAERDMVGLQLTGTTDNPYLGRRRGVALAQRVKQALDPTNTFLEA